MKLLSAFLLLLTVGNAQVIFSESFDSGVLPLDWSKRFGRVVAVDDGFAFGFANRTSGNDSFSAPIDLSGGGSFTLTFSFESSAIDNHSLLVGLSPDLHSTHPFFGSPIAATSFALYGVFEGSGGWTTVSFDLTPELALYTTAELSGMHLTFLSSNNGALSSLPVFLDDVQITAGSPSLSSIPEPSTYPGLAGLVALLLAVLRRKTL